ncbi:uncharacterized protein LOC127713073 [Mytilus californianus]|uniref:uncharacterized protein LOC127713073 n=1 Tax=Mytilus californianus TaxID=6549 RepID=UPI0022466535|nr:uncharacterized protein LOC127713073 [Mytilus californianus]
MKMWTCVLVCLMAYIQYALSNDCSHANIENDLQLCLDGIWNKANDKSAFWYGSNWQSICGYNPFAAPYCTVIQQPYTPHSLLNTVYGLNWNLTVNPLKQYLDITYQTPTGSYPSCGNKYTVTESKTFELQPLLSKNIHPWEARNIPTITWTALPNKLYTLYIFDTGSFIAHGIYININQNDIQNAEAIIPYHGPKNPTVRENAYVFLLFEQKNRIVLTNEWNQKLRQTMVTAAYNTTDAFQELDLTGPIAMNWLTAVKDPYSVQYFVNVGLINNCPNMVTEALKKKKISFIPDDVDLSMSLDINLHTTALNFDSCCTSYRYQEHTAKLNPIGDGYISPAHARSEATLTMTLLREGLLFIPSGKTDVRYTLLCVDISVPYPAAGTPDLPLLHMLVTNINGSDIASGDIIRSYLGPAPPDYVNHTYIFLLYTQTSMLNTIETQSYLTQGCSAGIDGRCLFNVTRFVDGAKLNLVGSTWFQATTDEYIRYTYVNRGQDPDSVCNNINGYANPCPVALSNDCSPANIKNGLQFCLDGIWNKANDKNAFWFGNNWQSICGLNPFAAPFCTVIKQPYTPHSLLNTMYGLNWNLTVNPLKQYLYITYQTPTGSYPSCGNTYKVTESKTFELQPLLSKNTRPWDVQTFPTITWTALPNKLYTLFIFDAGAYINHGVFININQNDIQNAEVIKPYSNPKNPTIREQPYVFLLFEQADRIVLTDEWHQKLNQSMVTEAFNYTDVFQELNLTGPIAMNWLQAVGDPYSIQFWVNINLINNCPNMVTEALKKKNISFIPDDVDLSMSLYINLHTTDLNFESCCTSYRYQEHTAKLNPIGDGYISPAHARSEASLTMTLQREGLLYIPSWKTDIRYTLLCVDISVPSPAAGTPDLPLLHMLVTNINGSDVQSGDIIRTYLGPAPPDYVNHTYIFLLYTQSSMLKENETKSYLTQGCSSGIDGRCLFNVTRFVDGSKLNLVGSTWFQATTDEYIRYTYVNRGQDPDSVCNNINGYGNPCPVGSTVIIKSSMFSVLLLCILAYISFTK